MPGKGPIQRRESTVKWDVRYDSARATEKDVFATNMRAQAIAFATASGGGTGLDFAAFQNMVHEQLHMDDVRATRLRRWFDACDRDQNGVIDAEEFFLFSIQAASGQGGFDVAGLSEVLIRAYDKSGDGQMDRTEFGKMARTLGFGEQADVLFDSFDKDGKRVPPSEAGPN